VPVTRASVIRSIPGGERSTCLSTRNGQRRSSLAEWSLPGQASQAAGQTALGTGGAVRILRPACLSKS
jgi:hypothetical protein